MKTRNPFKIFLTAMTLAAAVQAQASIWSITFDDKVSTDKTNVNISETVATIGGVTMGTASWGNITENEVWSGNSGNSWNAIDLSLADLTKAGAEAGKKIRFYATISNASDYALQFQAGWGPGLGNTDCFSDWGGTDNKITQNHPSFYKVECFELTIGNSLLSSLNEGTPLKVVNWGLNITRITIASGTGGSLGSKFVLQTGTTWLLRNNNQGLYSMNGGARSFGLLDCKAGQLITINASLNPNPQTNVTLKAQDGNNYKYLVTADGGVRFNPDRYIYIHSITIDPTYAVNYKIDGTVVKTEYLEAGETITPYTPDPRAHYTFAWGYYPGTMPAYDITIEGTYTAIPTHALTLYVDNKQYGESLQVEEGATIELPNMAERTGYTFAWSDHLTTMPGYDYGVYGNYTVRQYTLTYTVDGEEYKTYSVNYGATIYAEQYPYKEGFTFSGWSGLPETMPAENVTVTGTFSKTVVRHTISYVLDGQAYGEPQQLEEGEAITPPADPAAREGYVFSGWLNVPVVMPAYDVTIYGNFTKENTYTTLSVGSTGYNTFVSADKNIYFIGNEAIKAYIVTATSTTQATLRQVTGYIASGTPLILIGNANTSAQFETVDNGISYDDNLLVGVTGSSVTINAANKYVLVEKEDGVKFADTANRQAVVPAGKAYLQAPANASRSFAIVFENSETTGIDAAPNDKGKMINDNVIYNLSGKRVAQPRRGIYIVNGKKMYINK